ncbi:uncharacterized protein HD556DRAFT_1220082, partial [Suillus plorans]
SNTEIYNRWIPAMNTRLKKIDRLLTDSKRCSRKAIQADKTWSGLLLNEDNLPDNWVRQSGVLVSI